MNTPHLYECTLLCLLENLLGIMHEVGQVAGLLAVVRHPLFQVITAALFFVLQVRQEEFALRLYLINEGVTLLHDL